VCVCQICCVCCTCVLYTVSACSGFCQQLRADRTLDYQLHILVPAALLTSTTTPTPRLVMMLLGLLCYTPRFNLSLLFLMHVSCLIFLVLLTSQLDVTQCITNTLEWTSISWPRCCTFWSIHCSMVWKHSLIQHSPRTMFLGYLSRISIRFKKIT